MASQHQSPFHTIICTKSEYLTLGCSAEWSHSAKSWFAQSSLAYFSSLSSVCLYKEELYLVGGLTSPQSFLSTSVMSIYNWIDLNWMGKVRENSPSGYKAKHWFSWLSTSSIYFPTYQYPWYAGETHQKCLHITWTKVFFKASDPLFRVNM